MEEGFSWFAIRGYFGITDPQAPEAPRKALKLGGIEC